MQNPKFEKEVQRKMQDLEFVPSEAVWENVLGNMAPRGRRRMVAAFWWWLAPGLLALSAGGLLYLHGHSRQAVASNGTTGRSPQVAVAGPATGTGNEERAARVKDDKGTMAGNREASGDKATIRVAASASAGNGDQGGASRMEVGRMTERGDQGGASRMEVGLGVGDRLAGLNRTGRGAGRSLPGLIGGFASRQEIVAPGLYPEPLRTAVAGIRKPSHPWRAAFVGGLGVSSIEDAVNRGQTSGAVSGNTFAIIGPRMGVPAPGAAANLASYNASKRYDSRIKPGLSYRLGIYGEKSLSSRWSVDIGLDLHYYSVQLVTDEQVNSYAPSSASLFQSTALTYTYSSTNSYSAESQQTYLNRYFFLELPVVAEYRINNSRLLPIYWRGGAVFSYLMGSDAVYYDGQTGNYSKETGVARHEQASLTMGLMIGLPVRGVEIKAGPEVQYAVTGMLNMGSAGGHLVYGGMRVALMR